MKIKIGENIIVICTKRTGEKIQKELEQVRREEEAKINFVKKWLKNQDNYLDPYYSDIYKSVYGIKPY